MPRTRKHRWWDVVVDTIVAKEPFHGKARVRSKTYGGAVHKALKKLHCPKPLCTPYGGFEGVHCALAEV